MDYFLKYGEVKAEEQAYKMGYDCGLNGPTTTNSNFLLFSTEAKKRAWEEGKADAEAERPNKFERRVKCTCPCHQPGGRKMKHISPCCNNGYIDGPILARKKS